MRFIFIICTAFILTFAWNAYAEEAELNVTAGESFTFGVETELEEPSYSWALTRDGQIISTQAGRFFVYTIPNAMPSDLAVTIMDANGREETHSFKVVPQPAVEVSPSDQSFVRAIVRSEPPVSSDQVVTLPLYGGAMLLHVDESTGAIREYHIDTNTDADSDGDGDSKNDADNRMHPSFYAGGSFPVSIVPAPGEIEREIQLTVFGVQGEVSRTSIEAVFSAEVPLLPNLVTFPIANSAMGLITIPAAGGIISFDASGSTGGAARFALDLDLDLDTDSDSDGISDNDQDVSGSGFERSGKAISMFLKSIGGKRERRISLTVQRSDGQTASVSRMIRFTGAMPDSSSGSPEDGLKIVSDSRVIRVGEEFTLSIQDTPSSAASFEWDLQSDGKVDSKTDEPLLLLEPDAPGILPVRVTIYDESKSKVATVSSKFTVRTESYDEDSDDGMLDASLGKKELKIDVTTEGLTVSLKPVAGEGIDIHSLSPTWEFGDGEKSYLLTPSHQYSESGTYEVSLSLFDMSSEREVASAKTEVVVEGIPAIPSDDEEGGTASSIVSSIVSIFKIFIFVLLFLIVVGGIFAGALFLFAKSRGVKVQDLLKRKREDESVPASDADVPEENVSEIIEAASVPTETAEVTESAEPPPVKLEAEPEVEVVEDKKEEKKEEVATDALMTDMPPSEEKTKEEIPKPEPPKPEASSASDANKTTTPYKATEAKEPVSPEPEKTPEPQAQESLPPWLQATQGQSGAAPQTPPKQEASSALDANKTTASYKATKAKETPSSAVPESPQPETPLTPTPEPPKPVEPPPPPPTPEPVQAEEKSEAPAQEASPAPTSADQPSGEAQVPNWLEQGMEKAAEEGQTQESPPPAEISGNGDVPSVSSGGEQKETKETKEAKEIGEMKKEDAAASSDDETIAIVEAELPEEKDDASSQRSRTS